MVPLLYAFLTAIATIIGGLLPFHKFFKKINFKYLVAFSAGTMMAIVFFDLLPETKTPYLSFTAVGFFTVYLIEKFVMLHSCGECDCEEHSLGWPAMIGVAAESITDGLALAAGYAIAPSLGFSIMIAIISHELPRGFTTTIIMQNAKKKPIELAVALAIDSGFTILGALIGLQFTNLHLGYILAFTTGTFIYIGAADLLPEAHKKFNWQVVFSVILGVALIFILTNLIAH